MIQEEKDLLLKDLSARLPYGVKVHTWYNKPMDVKCTGVDAYTNTVNLDISNDDDAKVYIENVKPYLRPMSSMTEEEREEFQEYVFDSVEIGGIMMLDASDWLNEHHFDYRGLIPMGLALEAPEGMYKTK